MQKLSAPPPTRPPLIELARSATSAILALLFLVLLPCPAPVYAASAKIHTVVLGAVRKVPYTPSDATPDNKSEETSTLKVRPLIVDGKQKEWTTGDAHDVTDRSFTIRRALRINDSLPADAGDHWVWQPGPWLLVDRVSGHITALHLPDFDANVSNVVWFRDYAAYCGVATTSKGGLFAVVAQLGARKAVAQRPLGKWPQPERPLPACQPAQWQRLPIRATLQPTGGDAVTLDIIGSTSLVEEGDNDDS